MSKQMNDIGMMFIAEQSSPEENSVSNLSHHDMGGGVFFAQFDTVLQTFRTLNRNKRKYWGPNVEERLKDERIVSMLRDNAWYGEMDHPSQQYKNMELTPERVQQIWMPNRSHKIMNPTVHGDIMRATIQTASGSDPGMGFYREIMQGLVPSFSCRSIASIKMINGEPYVVISKLITYDWVLYPSHKEAKITGDPKFISKSEQLIQESAAEKMYLPEGWSKYTEDVMIPLMDLIKVTADQDENIRAICESFELDLSDFAGFTNDNQAIIRDDNNVIFVKTSPKTHREIRDYLGSF